MSSSNYIQSLLEANPLREPLLRKVIHSLHLPPGSHGLDAGCGIGLQARLLADAVGPIGHVTALDIAPELLAFGAERADRAGYADRITFRQGDVNALPLDDDTFDWVWSADCIGYPIGDLTSVLKELKRVIKPGGSLILLGWSSQQLLPGHPFLEARLNATCSAYLPFIRDTDPELNFLRAGRQLREAGLEAIEARTFVGDVQAPLDRDRRTALLSLFEMLWGQPQPETSPDDWREYQRLCRPASPDCILDIDGYYAFFTYTVFRGQLPLKKAALTAA